MSQPSIGPRLSWKTLPPSLKVMKDAVVPLGCIHTPLIQSPEIPKPAYPALWCMNGACKAILNAHCQVDFTQLKWVCSFCGGFNSFPTAFRGMSPENKIAELYPNYQVFEYPISNHTPVAPTYFFVIDTCLKTQELDHLKKAITTVVSTMPDHINIGLVTIGTAPRIYELGFSYCTRSFTFRANVELTPTIILKQLGFSPTKKPVVSASSEQSTKKILDGASSLVKDMASAVGSVASAAADLAVGTTSWTKKTPASGEGLVTPQIRENLNSRFVVPLGSCRERIMEILESLSPDSWPVFAANRSKRATGNALSLATHVLGMAKPLNPGLIMTFIGGPSSVGPGMVVDIKKKSVMRSHADIKKRTPSSVHFEIALEFYSNLANQIVSNGHAMHIFSCYYDQSGVLEMSTIPQRTGGLIFLGDEFKSRIFQRSFIGLFCLPVKNQVEDTTPNENNQKSAESYADAPVSASGQIKWQFNTLFGFSASVRVVTQAQEIKLCGMIGPGASSGFVEPNTDTSAAIGIGKTSTWLLNVLQPESTLTNFFKIVRDASKATSQGTYIQIQTCYIDSMTGMKRMRVATLAAPYATPQNQLIAGFDQGVGAAIVAKMAAYKLHSSNSTPKQVIHWCDQSLIRFCTTHCLNGGRFAPPPTAQLYAQYMFNLRRSSFLQTANFSPDETLYRRFWLLRESFQNTLLMIQPQLVQFPLQGPPKPVLLATSSLNSRCILLLDTFFHIVVWFGKDLASWRDQKLHETEQYAHLKQYFGYPHISAMSIISKRFPVPRYTTCDADSSQERFLVSKLNPTPQNSSFSFGQPGQPGQQNPAMAEPTFHTDDVSYEEFIQKLSECAIKQNK